MLWNNDGMFRHPHHQPESTRKKWRPIGLSLLFHAILVGFLIFLGNRASKSLSTEPDRRGSIVLAVAPDDQPDRYLDQNDSVANEPADQLDTPPPVASADTPPPQLNVQEIKNPIANLDGPPPIETPNLDATSMTRSDATTGQDNSFELSPEALKLIEAEQARLRNLAPKGDPTSISVFGSGQMTGRSFVFLIDRSKSMGSSGLGVLAAARTELATAIVQLKPYHSFQIVGYHDRIVTLSTRQMLDATEANKKMVPGFIARLAAFGSTDHLRGLSAALAFEPDVLVLMTDGGYPELNDGQIRMLSRLSRRDTTIHCIQFGSGPLQIRTNFMTKLAKENQGNFRYVDTNQWSKP
jgi:hypothetical protein